MNRVRTFLEDTLTGVQRNYYVDSHSPNTIYLVVGLSQSESNDYMVEREVYSFNGVEKETSLPKRFLDCLGDERLREDLEMVIIQIKKKKDEKPSIFHQNFQGQKPPEQDNMMDDDLPF